MALWHFVQKYFSQAFFRQSACFYFSLTYSGYLNHTLIIKCSFNCLKYVFIPWFEILSSRYFHVEHNCIKDKTFHKFQKHVCKYQNNETTMPSSMPHDKKVFILIYLYLNKLFYTYKFAIFEIFKVKHEAMSLQLLWQVNFFK